MRPYRKVADAERAAIWEGWKSGLSMADIGRGLGRRASGVFRVLRSTGGYAPRPQVRARCALREAEREEISRGMAAQMTIRAIARKLDRCPSTISREVKRNGGRQSYRAATADAQAWRRARRPQRCRLAQRPGLRDWVAAKLHRDWSPGQIAVGLRRAFPDDQMRVSHETIYRSLFVQARGVLKRELVGHLRQAGVMRRGRKARALSSHSIVDGVSIRERPPEVNDRAVPGHWEGDLLMGDRYSQIATLVERRSRYVMLVKIDQKDAKTVNAALARTIRRLPAELRRSLTWDRGSEMSGHKDLTIATNVQVYFCDPYSPWQRGSNENTNGLLRQYFAKGDDLSRYSQSDLNKIARRLNERPRETLNWATPHEALKQAVATTL
jgi:IS30 family transposase